MISRYLTVHFIISITLHLTEPASSSVKVTPKAKVSAPEEDLLYELDFACCSSGLECLPGSTLAPPSSSTFNTLSTLSPNTAAQPAGGRGSSNRQPSIPLLSSGGGLRLLENHGVQILSRNLCRISLQALLVRLPFDARLINT